MALASVSGHEQHLDARLEFLQPVGQFAAADVRHHHIGQDQIDALPLTEQQRVVGVFHWNHPVAVFLFSTAAANLRTSA